MMRRITLTLPEEDVKTLEALSAQSRGYLSVSALVRLSVERALKDLALQSAVEQFR